VGRVGFEQGYPFDGVRPCAQDDTTPNAAIERAASQRACYVSGKSKELTAEGHRAAVVRL
jgi:hypothetical protein